MRCLRRSASAIVVFVLVIVSFDLPGAVFSS